jgi:hypothetical protein
MQGNQQSGGYYCNPTPDKRFIGTHVICILFLGVLKAGPAIVYYRMHWLSSKKFQ